MKIKTKTPQKKIQNLANTSAMQKANKNTPINKKNISKIAANTPQALKNTGTPKQIQNGGKNVRKDVPKLIPLGKPAKNGKANKHVQVDEELSDEEEEEEEDEDEDESSEDEEQNEAHFVTQEEIEEADDDDDDDDEDEEEDDSDEEENVQNERSLVTVAGNLGEAEDDDDDEEEEEDDDEEEDEEEAAEQTKAAVDEEEDDDDDDDDEEEEEAATITEKQTKAAAESDEEEEDEGPAVAPINKSMEEPAEGTNEKAKFTNETPDKFPEENTIVIKNGIEKLKVMKLFALLKIFGNIVNIHKSDEEWSVTFATKESAVLALLFYPELPLKEKQPITTSSKVITAEQLQKLEAKTVIIRQFMPLPEVRNVFSAWGKIAYLGFVPQKNILKSRNIAIVFETAAAAKKALQMHNSIVNGRNILLTSKKTAQKQYDADRTIRVLNTAKHGKFK